MAGRLILMTGGVATVLVAANPEPAGSGGSLPHTFWAAIGFIALAAWPLAARKRGLLVPAGLRPAVPASAAGVLLGLLVWFGAELIAGGRQVGLSERVLAGGAGGMAAGGSPGLPPKPVPRPDAASQR